MQNGRPSVEQHAARVAMETARLEIEAPLLQALLSMSEQLRTIRDELAEVRDAIDTMGVINTKDWYTTSDLAQLMGVSRHHVTVRWCNSGRIECEKDATTGKWRIPGSEYERLKRGGNPRPPIDRG